MHSYTHPFFLPLLHINLWQHSPCLQCLYILYYKRQPFISESCPLNSFNFSIYSLDFGLEFSFVKAKLKTQSINVSVNPYGPLSPLLLFQVCPLLDDMVTVPILLATLMDNKPAPGSMTNLILKVGFIPL